MSFVNDEKVEGSRVSVRIRGQELVEPAHLRLELDPLHRHDKSRMGTERVHAYTPLASQAAHMVGVDDLETQPELLAHLALPLPAEARRADHENFLSLVAQHQLSGDQTGLDGLAQPDIIRYQQDSREASAAP